MSRKYLFVIDSFGAGGAERSLIELIPHFVDHGISPIVACLKTGGIGFEEEVGRAGLEVHLLPRGRLITRIRALRALVRDQQPHLIYTSLFDADLAGRLAAIGTGVPVVTCLVNTAYDPARRADPNVRSWRLKAVKTVDGFTARHLTNHFHAISEAVKESTIDTLGVRRERITVVKRGRDNARLGTTSPDRRAASRAALGLDPDQPVVVTVGRQEYQKGHRFLIEAFRGVVSDVPGARLLIAGRPGHLSQELHSLVDELELGEAITFLGHRDDVAEVLAAADVFAFPSLYEGLGGAVIEAMALSLPVVASDIPAMREVVRAGENALLIAPRDVPGLRDALVSLLEQSDVRARFGLRSREIFEADFRLDETYIALRDLFDRVAREAGRA